MDGETDSEALEDGVEELEEVELLVALLDDEPELDVDGDSLPELETLLLAVGDAMREPLREALLL